MFRVTLHFIANTRGGGRYQRRVHDDNHFAIQSWWQWNSRKRGFSI